MSGTLSVGRTGYTVALPPLTLAVTTFSLGESRKFDEQADITGGLHLRVVAPAATRLTLKGFCVRSDAATAALALEDKLRTNAAISFDLAGLHFAGLHLLSYEVEDTPGHRGAAVSVTLLGAAALTAEEV